MTIKVSKPAINIREELADLKQDTGLKGQELMRADTAQEARTAIGAGRKNLFINGGFDVWQRGTSITSAGAYNADRWHSSHGASLTTSRQTFTVGQTDVPNNPKYYQRTDGTGLSSSESFEIRHHIEGVETAANQQVTLSFYAKSSVTATHENMFWQRFDNWSDFQTGIGSSNFTTTTSWQRFTRTFTLADISGETVVAGTNTLTFVIDGEAGFTGTFDLAQVQLEVGSVATDFEHRSYGEELALCQRYYQKSFLPGVTPTQGASTTSWATGIGIEGAAVFESHNGSDIAYFKFPVRMRTNPTMGRYGNSQGYAYCFSGGGFHVNSGGLTGYADGFRLRQQRTTAYAYVQVHWTADAEL